MKKLIFASTLLTSSLIAQTTMCFKQNHKDLTTIETAKLNGGECRGAYSLNEMKSNEWRVNDIKITPNSDGTSNFVYILKKGDQSTNFSNLNSNISQEELEERLLKRLEDKRKQEKIKEKEDLKLANIQAGKKTYIQHCASCHGNNGELKPYNVSRKLNVLPLNEFQAVMRDYLVDDYDLGYKTVMLPYVNIVNEYDIENIFNYLDSINTKVSK